jgi:hypothetical protein
MVATPFSFSSAVDYLMMPEVKGRITFPALLGKETKYSEVFHGMHGSFFIVCFRHGLLKMCKFNFII